MQESEETKQIPGDPKLWWAMIVVAGLMISVAAGCSSYVYDDVLQKMMALPAFPLVLGGLFIIGLLTVVLRVLLALVARFRGRKVQRPVGGKWSFVWVAFKLACLLAVVTLGGVALIALVIGNPERMFQGFLLVLVSSALLSFTGSVLLEASRVVRMLRQ